MVKTRDLFNKIRDTKGTFHVKTGAKAPTLDMDVLFPDNDSIDVALTSGPRLEDSVREGPTPEPRKASPLLTQTVETVSR